VRELRAFAVHVQSEAVARLLAVVKGCTSAHLGGATAGLFAVLALRAVDVAAVLVADLLLLSVHLCHAGSLPEGQSELSGAVDIHFFSEPSHGE